MEGEGVRSLDLCGGGELNEGVGGPEAGSMWGLNGGRGGQESGSMWGKWTEWRGREGGQGLWGRGITI